MSVHDRWQGARSGEGRRYEVRWRSGGQQRKKRFALRKVADEFEAQQRVAPEVRRAHEGRALTVEKMMATWLATKTGLEPKTIDAYRADVREVVTEFGGRLASSVRPSEVRTWVGRDRGLSLRRRSLVALKGAYKVAIGDKLLAENPCATVKAPRGDEVEMRFLSWEELARLTKAVGPYWAPLVWLLGTVGLRIGEAVGLQVGDVGERRLNIRRAVKHASGGVVVGLPKGHQRREVPVPPFVLAQLPTQGRRPGEWLFLTHSGVRMDANNWRADVFKPAALKAGLGDLHPHELRHTAASLAIAAGADLKVVQRMLGHRRAAMTSDLYGHLKDERLDEVADSMQKGASRAHAYIAEAL